MKLPYSHGDLFALPLGDGTFAQAQIIGCAHHTVDLAIEALAPIRSTDRALVLARWRRTGRAPVDRDMLPKSAYWRGAAYVERAIATLLGKGMLLQPPLFVKRGAYAPAVPTARSDDELRRLPGDLRALRLSSRAWKLSARQIVRFQHLERLDCSGVTIDRPECLAELSNLAALRVARIDRFDLRTLRDVRGTTLAFESVRDLRHIDALLERPTLRQLELLDLWPCELNDVIPLTEHPCLVRAEIDIGGRRKNVELYRRAHWAYPWPFDLGAA